MRQVAKRGILTVVATGSVLASTAGYAYAAGSEAQGVAANSPGVGSGNTVQAPVDIPVNACGNTVNVIGLLNPAYGNQCGNVSQGHGASTGTSSSTGSGGSTGSGASTGTGGTHAGGSSASGGSHGSPGVVSGNTVSVPVSAPVNACGNTVDVVGLGNPAYGNSCGNTHVHETPPPPTKPEECGCTETPPPAPPKTPETPPSGTPRGGEGTPTPVTVATPDHLASTGASGLELIAPAGLALLLGGGVLYRRSRAGAR
ncbi:chaplin [Kitasatospora sp. DSM 101779]|uniref:chaplin n=1 Tax=Kitasatospora sp. DSM 101779 TaxID=2853165 RepID=UPI0021D84547|nr:chaplin [Kitasatospora sp. DSM 101779]MCU7821661.1 chaplin [Kitasatospora sp. DSM 101779]